MAEDSGRAIRETPIRVLHLNPAFKPDGPGWVILTLMRYFPPDRVSAEACSLSAADPTMENYLMEYGIRHTSLGTRGVWDARAVPRMVRFLRERRVDILHTHLTRADWVGRTAARFAGTSVVVSTVHNLNREVYRAECGRMAAAVAPRLDRITGRWADALIAVSEDVKAWLVEEGYPERKIHCIPNAVDLDALRNLDHDIGLKPELLHVPVEAPVIGTVAAFKEQKGHRYLVEAADRIRRQHGNAQFLLVGSGPTYSKVCQQIRNLNLDSAFVCVGQKEDVVPYLKLMDVFVLPSLWEGMPRALMEAMAAGIPAIGTDVSGIRELIEDGVTGLLVPAANADALAMAITNMLSDPPKARRLADAARGRIRERHSALASARRHAQLYAELLEARERSLSKADRSRFDA